MIIKRSSVASILEGIISDVEETFSREQNCKLATKRKHEDISMTSTWSKKARYEPLDTEVHCRICYDTSQQLSVVYPCRCKGTMGAIHLSCLERWLEESNRNNCELCGHEFQVERTPRYKALTSIVIWLCLNQQRHQSYSRNLKTDLLRCIIVTPITFVCSYICVVGADFYAKSNYDNFPPARWTTYSLLAMLGILMFSYFLWLYMVAQYHQKAWFCWWQKTSKVKVTLPSENRNLINHKINISHV